MKICLRVLLLMTSLLAGYAGAAEFKIGDAIIKNGMEIQPLYIQAVAMKHGGAGAHAGHHGDAGADIHLEVSVHAEKDNAWGFAKGHWIPYLTMNYRITKKDSKWSTNGSLAAMAANNGPHYGNNVKLDGAGKYILKYYIAPPTVEQFPYHIDKETGVQDWWRAMNLEAEFVYIGVGKKGGY